MLATRAVEDRTWRHRASPGGRGGRVARGTARKKYVQRLEQFWDFVVRYNLRTGRSEELDSALVDVVDWAFLDGESPSVGNYLKAATDAFPEQFSMGRLGGLAPGSEGR